MFWTRTFGRLCPLLGELNPGFSAGETDQAYSSNDAIEGLEPVCL